MAALNILLQNARFSGLYLIKNGSLCKTKTGPIESGCATELHQESEVFHAGAFRSVPLERNDIPESVCVEPPDLSPVFLTQCLRQESLTVNFVTKMVSYSNPRMLRKQSK